MNSFRLLVAASLFTLLLSGCRVTDNKNGKNDNVAITTPFGDMQVKTNDKVDTSSIGLTAYPGATVVKDEDNSSADVNMSFGSFHLGVKAASFQTTDSSDKVLAFYRKDMAKYGDIIQCKGNTPIGTPTHTAQGLTCDSTNQNHISTGSADALKDAMELRTGSTTRQHIVAVEPKDGATRIGLVMLNLPSNLNTHENKDPE